MSPSAQDSDLTAVDWVLAILCSGIGCIVSIIYLVQGKPKGTKMLIISLVMVVVWNVIGFIARSMTGQGQGGGGGGGFNQ